jgi:choline dehydrogenase-like flavoprotein
MAPLLAGLKLARRLFATQAFAPLRAVEVFPGPGVRSDAELEAYVRRMAVTVHHPLSTCRMGADGDAVVDAGLRVRGVASLRVVDGSIFPVMLGGNTNAPIVMVAEKAADLMQGRAPPAPVAGT